MTIKNLRDVFEAGPWRDMFTALAKNLEFSLTVYSSDEKPVFALPAADRLCHRLRARSQEFSSQCEKRCRPIMQGVFKTGKPRIFKSRCKIMHFILPIEYQGDKAVIKGEGLFPSFKDYFACKGLLSSAGITMFLRTPSSFTSYQQARRVSGFIADFVNRLLEHTWETAALSKTLESINHMSGMWEGLRGEQPEKLYRSVTNKLFSLLDIDEITLLNFDKERNRYSRLYCLSRHHGANGAIDLGDYDAIARELLGRKSVQPAKFAETPAGYVHNNGDRHSFFPILVGNNLEGVLCISGENLTERDRQFVTVVCRQTALLIENRHLSRKLHSKFDGLPDISKLTATTSLNGGGTLPRTFLDLSARMLGAEQGSLMLFDQKTDTLLLEAKICVSDGVPNELRINRGEGIAGKVAEHGEALLVANLEDDPRVHQKKRSNYKTRSFVSVPLKVQERIIGVLNLSDKANGENFHEDDLVRVQSFANYAAVIMERNELSLKTEELKKETVTDYVTGLMNRRYLHECLREELARSERHEHRFCVLMLDMDGFKYCNDTFGHSFGDETLKTIANTLQQVVRSFDIVARYGGDEFVVILPETDEPLGIDIAERIRARLAMTVVPPALPNHDKSLDITASIGFACYPHDGTTAELLLEKADTALYRAKGKGKNRVEIFHKANSLSITEEANAGQGSVIAAT